MDLITSGVAAAGIKAAGSPLGALIGRYRPTGIPRLGSREDRAGAYHRMLDASTRSFAYSYQFANLRSEAGRASHKLLTAQMPAMWEISRDLISALNGVRLCGSVQVIDAAEKLVTAAGNGSERAEGGPLPTPGRGRGCRPEDVPGHLPGRTLLQRPLVPAPAQAQGEALPSAARSRLTTPVPLEPPVHSDRIRNHTVRAGCGSVGHDGTPDRRRSAMPTPLPALTPEQRAEALAKAGRVRKERSEMLAALKAGRLSLLDVLDRGDDTARQTRALQLLQSLPGVGTVKARRHLVDLGISETRRIQGLGERQRARLVEVFPPQA